MVNSASTIQSVYTDGACSGNPGPGGWGTVVQYKNGAIHELGGFEPQTTNNRMEMKAAIAALGYILQAPSQADPIVFYTDSEYVKNGITQWLKGWKRKKWKTSAGKPVLNQDLWQELDDLTTRVNAHLKMPLEWRYVRGHSGNPGNERCDAIARAFSLGQTPALTVLDAELGGDRPSDDIAMSAIPTQSSNSAFDTSTTDKRRAEALEFKTSADYPLQHTLLMVDSYSSQIGEDSDLPREVRVSQLRNLVETLRMADEIASQGYLITSSELADLMDVNASAVTSRGDNWVWRNWVVSRVRREGNQILWQLERVD